MTPLASTVAAYTRNEARAGPRTATPLMENSEPWQGQNSGGLPDWITTVQPACVQTADSAVAVVSPVRMTAMGPFPTSATTPSPTVASLGNMAKVSTAWPLVGVTVPSTAPPFWQPPSKSAPQPAAVAASRKHRREIQT